MRGGCCKRNIRVRGWSPRLHENPTTFWSGHKISFPLTPEARGMPALHSAHSEEPVLYLSAASCPAQWHPPCSPTSFSEAGRAQQPHRPCCSPSPTLEQNLCSPSRWCRSLWDTSRQHVLDYDSHSPDIIHSSCSRALHHLSRAYSAKETSPVL